MRKSVNRAWRRQRTWFARAMCKQLTKEDGIRGDTSSVCGDLGCEYKFIAIECRALAMAAACKRGLADRWLWPRARDDIRGPDLAGRAPRVRPSFRLRHALFLCDVEHLPDRRWFDHHFGASDRPAVGRSDQRRTLAAVLGYSCRQSRDRDDARCGRAGLRFGVFVRSVFSILSVVDPAGI